ncbi:hypothetical protein QNA08_06545 [Chelatococcus sp. SYSU_G07232]|uniref:Adenylate cyclase n=1 Tax=Chelatococcus albus TaxID=3047466 RepID=A0ABT7AEV1_9HYPH|nr:hypothetical protein [Chelatococcus sp. SYSU_G07232]MDJ1157890.1 hypothetical protein [Chelatococcus sp. SYSU_G07232]
MAELATPVIETEPVPREEIREALARVLASDAFRSAPQLSAFLTFVVERTLEGRAQEIKGYTIATEALGRDDSFDPQADPIVRVEAMRLRRALDTYYTDAGGADPVRIDIPRGSYVPQFQHNAASPTLQEQEHEAHGLPAAASWLDDHRGLAAAALALALAALIAALFLPTFGLRQGYPSREDGLHERTVARPEAQSRFAPYLPLVVVEPVETQGAMPAWFSGNSLVIGVANAIARFDEVQVLDRSAAAPGAADSLPRAAERYRLVLRLANLLDTVAVSARLIHEASGAVVWTRDFQPVGPENATTNAELWLARSIAATIAQPYGVIFADLRNRPAAPPEWRCLSMAFDYWHGPTEARHAEVRDCLEAVVAAQPGFASAQASLAFAYLEEYRSGYNHRAGATLDRALAAAMKAVQIAPESARAHQALLDVHFIRGEHAEAFAAGRKALERNPDDTNILADLGARHIAFARYAEGLPMLEQARAGNPAHPPWLDFFIFLGAHMTGDDAKARSASSRIVGDDDPLGLVARAIAADADGDGERAARSLRRLLTLVPEMGRNPRLLFERCAFASPIVERLASDLKRAGLDAMTAVRP